MKNLPAIGILLFFCLFLFSSTLYPGGSQADLTTEGFDWVHNYWCNLLNIRAMNGSPNPARPYAIAATIILCASMGIFFWQFPISISMNNLCRRMIRTFGLLSMGCAALIFTQWHDLMTTLASIFGLVALTGVVISIIRNQMHSFLWSSLLCILLMGLNNYIYYSNQYLLALPLLQKITFLVILGWVIALNYSMGQRRKQTESVVVR